MTGAKTRAGTYTRDRTGNGNRARTKTKTKTRTRTRTRTSSNTNRRSIYCFSSDVISVVVTITYWFSRRVTFFTTWRGSNGNDIGERCRSSSGSNGGGSDGCSRYSVCSRIGGGMRGR